MALGVLVRIGDRRNRVLPTLLPQRVVLAAALTVGGVPAARAHPPTTPTLLHVVRQGQTVRTIAKSYQTTVARLCADNARACQRPLRAGQALRITAQDPPTSQPSVVRSQSRAKRDPYATRPRRPGFVVLEGSFGSFSGFGVTAKGKVPKSTSAGFERMLACRRTGKKWPIHERLIRVVTQVSDHFGGRSLRVVSGFRPWSYDQYTTESKHNVGQALDFSIPGVPNQALRDFCRSFRDVGCGYYPNSSFVHLDVREQSAYWVDYSGPGEAPRYAHAGAKAPISGDPSPKAPGNATEHDSAIHPGRPISMPEPGPASEPTSRIEIGSDLTEIGRLLRGQGSGKPGSGIVGRDRGTASPASSASVSRDPSDKKRPTSYWVAPASSSRRDTRAPSQPEGVAPRAMTTRARSIPPRSSRPAGS